MSLLITITKSPDNAQLTEASKTFSEQGGSIGRSAENNWILPDPDKFLSGSHSQISCENGQYFLTDLSTNGTFMNGAVEPMGKNNKIQLKDGDRFSLGDYELQVSLWGAESSEANNIMADSSDPFGSPDASFNDAPANMDSPFGDAAGYIPSAAEPLFSTEAEETDPLAALDKMGQSNDNIPQSDVFGASYSDQSNAVNQQVNWPDSIQENAGGIPDDWDDDALSASPPSPMGEVPEPAFNTTPSDIENKQQSLEQSNEKIQAELDALKQQLASQQIAANRRASAAKKPVKQAAVAKPIAKASSADKTMIETMGLSGKNLTDAQIQNISQVVGEMVRETVSGMMKVLSSRSSIKNEFRMNVTTIQPVENNPLKFSANIDDALENMFIKEGDSYKKPVDAVREGFEGIAEHQVAIIAGIRSAFSGVMERFNPVVLEQRFSKQNKGGLMLGSHKAKNWDSFCQYYEGLVDDMDNSFQYLYGDEFVQAYEDQLQKLTINKKSKKN